MKFDKAMTESKENEIDLFWQLLYNNIQEFEDLASKLIDINSCCNSSCKQCPFKEVCDSYCELCERLQALKFKNK